MSEVSCQNCESVCCKGQTLFLTMQLSAEEAQFMEEGGNVLQVIENPADYDRPDARYPIDAIIHADKGTIQWVYSKEHPTEPLPAGFGRYALYGACKYLVMDENGHELCSVYEKRPAVCRDFEVGGEKCLIFRRRFGIDVEPVIFRKS